MSFGQKRRIKKVIAANRDRIALKNSPELTKRTKKRQNGQAKERLLDAATELFARKGFHGTSTREITEQAGTNLSGLYFHWQSKAKLYVGVHRRLFEHLTEVSREIVKLLEQGLRSSQSLEQIMEAVTDRVFEFFGANPTLARLNLHRVLDEGTLTARIEKEFENPLYHAMALCYRRLTEEGMIKVGDPELLPFTLEAVLDRYFAGPAHLERSLGLKRDELLARMREHFRETFLRLLKRG